MASRYEWVSRYRHFPLLLFIAGCHAPLISPFKLSRGTRICSHRIVDKYSTNFGWRHHSMNDATIPTISGYWSKTLLFNRTKNVNEPFRLRTKKKETRNFSAYFKLSTNSFRRIIGLARVTFTTTPQPIGWIKSTFLAESSVPRVREIPSSLRNTKRFEIALRSGILNGYGFRYFCCFCFGMRYYRDWEA